MRLGGTANGPTGGTAADGRRRSILLPPAARIRGRRFDLTTGINEAGFVTLPHG